MTIFSSAPHYSSVRRQLPYPQVSPLHLQQEEGKYKKKKAAKSRCQQSLSTFKNFLDHLP
jgi:hypothetical protein